MNARDKMQNDGDNIINLYSELQDRIFNEIIKALKRANFANVKKEDVLKWQIEQLNNMGVLNERIIKLVADYDGISKQAIYDFVADNGMSIIDEADLELQRIQQRTVPPSEEASAMIDALRSQTWKELNNNVNQSLITRNFGNSAPMRAYQAILKQATLESMTGLKTNERAIKDAIYKQVDAGLQSNLVDKAGHRWSLEGYTRTVITTTTNRAYNQLRTQRMKDFGQTLCVMSWHMASREACAYIQGHVVNMIPPEDPRYNKKYDSIYNHGYGDASGTLGINCHHIFYPFSEGINTNNQHPTVTPETAIENAKLQKKQRQYERSIRDAKRRLKVAEELEDSNMISHSKTLIANRQKRLREFIKEANKEEQILSRDYSREQLYSIGIEADKKDLIKKRLTVNPDKQNVHIKGTMEYDRRMEQSKTPGHKFYGQEPSYFTISAEKLEEIVKEKIDLSRLSNQYQFIDIGEPIGVYKNGDIVAETTRIRVALSRTGYHAVPALPKELRKRVNKRKNK